VYGQNRACFLCHPAGNEKWVGCFVPILFRRARNSWKGMRITMISVSYSVVSENVIATILFAMKFHGNCIEGWGVGWGELGILASVI